MGNQHLNNNYLVNTLVSVAGVVDVCLIPEIQFSMEKLCEHVAKVFEKKGHCVICVAEGAGQVGFIFSRSRPGLHVCLSGSIRSTQSR